MKKLIILTIIATLSFQLKAQNDKFTENMKKNILLMDSVKEASAFIDLANKFERIASVEKNNWLPYYYASLNYSIASFFEENNKTKDQHVDKAEQMLLEATKVAGKDNSEVLLLQAYVTNARLVVKPGARGRKLGPLFNTQIEMAKKVNPDNPRIYCLEGESLFYTPPMFGGGKDKAQPVLETAMKKFDIYKPESDIHPNWGKDRCETLINECKEL